MKSELAGKKSMHEMEFLGGTSNRSKHELILQAERLSIDDKGNRSHFIYSCAFLLGAIGHPREDTLTHKHEHIAYRRGEEQDC